MSQLVEEENEEEVNELSTAQLSTPRKAVQEEASENREKDPGEEHSTPRRLTRTQKLALKKSAEKFVNKGNADDLEISPTSGTGQEQQLPLGRTRSGSLARSMTASPSVASKRSKVCPVKTKTKNT